MASHSQSKSTRRLSQSRRRDLPDTRMVRYYQQGCGQVLDKHSMRSALIFRHIVMSYNIPLSTFPALFPAFFFLFLGRPAEQNDLPSTRCVRNHIMKCGIIDKHLTAEKFEKTFTQVSLWLPSLLVHNDRRHQARQDISRPKACSYSCWRLGFK